MGRCNPLAAETNVPGSQSTTESAAPNGAAVPDNRRKRRRYFHRIIVWFVLATLLTSGTVAAVLCMAIEPQLLGRSTQVAEVTDWCNEDARPEYRWLTDTILFAVCNDQNPPNPIRYDTTNHRKHNLTALNSLMTSDGPRTVSTVQLSLDGRWILWTGYLRNFVHIARLDGTGYQEVIASSPESICGVTWLTNHEWLVDTLSSNAHDVYRGDIRNPGKRYRLPYMAWANFVDDSGMDPGGRFSDVVLRYKRPTGLAVRRTVHLLAPHDTMIISEACTVDRKRIAFIVRAWRPRLFADWIGKVLPTYASGQTSIELWMGHTETNDLHRIGYLTIEPPFDAASIPLQLQWLPSETKLSFIYKGALRTITVN